MIGHYLLTLYRSLSRHRLYAAINVLGLAVGVAVFLVLLLDVRFETRFERWIPDARQIYVIRTSGVGPLASQGAYDYTMGGLLEELRADYPQLLGARIWDVGGTVHQGSTLTSEQVEEVDPTFFQVFDVALVSGDKAHVLHAPDDIILTQAKAKQYFGGANPLGQRMTVAFNGALHVYRVAGVLKDPPKTTDLQMDFLVPLKVPTKAEDDYWYHWGSTQLSTYFRFTTADQARALDANVDGFTDRHGLKDMGRDASKSMRLRTQPLLSVHLLDPKDAAVVGALGAVGLLTLGLAAVNYVNLASATAGLRAREVAVRKVMGATELALIGQFMAEAVATAALGALLGLALCELALPMVNAAGGLALKLDYLGDPTLLASLAVVILAVGLGAGLYPALVLSRFQAAAVLAAAKTPGGGRASGRVREGLVVVQFAVSVAFTISTAVVVSQTSFLRHADIGFKRAGLIVVNSFDDSEVTAAQRASLLAAWRTLPGVVGAAIADMAPGVNDMTNTGNAKRPGQPGDGPQFGDVNVGPNFFSTYGARLIAGRWPDQLHGGDYIARSPPPAPGQPPQPVTAAQSATAAPRNVVLNAGAVRALGFNSPQDAVGRTVMDGVGLGRFRPITVIGVIDDIRFRSPRDRVPPTIYYGRTDDFDNPTAGVRYAGADPRAVMDRMAAAWRRIAPAVPFRAETGDGNLVKYYKADDQHGRLFIIGALLAVAIGCVGLYGLASFNTARRVKEIGIRKTLGASTADILRLLVGQFLRPVVIANLFAWPLAGWAMSNWLSGFDQRIALTPVYFLGATALTLLVAVGTVAGQAYAVACAEPAKALRHE